MNVPATVSIDVLAGAVIDQLTDRTDGVVVEMLVYVALAVVVSLDFTVSAGAVVDIGVLIVVGLEDAMIDALAGALVGVISDTSLSDIFSGVNVILSGAMTELAFSLTVS